jgi:hypothetical protein
MCGQRGLDTLAAGLDVSRSLSPVPANSPGQPTGCLRGSCPGHVGAHRSNGAGRHPDDLGDSPVGPFGVEPHDPCNGPPAFAGRQGQTVTGVGPDRLHPAGGLVTVEQHTADPFLTCGTRCGQPVHTIDHLVIEEAHNDWRPGRRTALQRFDMGAVERSLADHPGRLQHSHGQTHDLPDFDSFFHRPTPQGVTGAPRSTRNPANPLSGYVQSTVLRPMAPVNVSWRHRVEARRSDGRGARSQRRPPARVEAASRGVLDRADNRHRLTGATVVTGSAER